MRNNLILSILSLSIGMQIFSMQEGDDAPTSSLPEEKAKKDIALFIQAKAQGRSGVRALATPRGESKNKMVMRSDFKKTEVDIYHEHVLPLIMKEELSLKANPHLYIDEPFPSTMLLTGVDGMRSGLLAKALAKMVDADYQEILHWRAKGTLDLMKGFALTGDEKKDKVILVRDLALLGRDIQGKKEQSYTILIDQLKNSIIALHKRKHQVDHRVYVVAATAYEELVPAEVKELFKKTYSLVIPDTQTAGAIVRGFAKAMNGEELDLSSVVDQLHDFSFDDLKNIVSEAAKEAVKKGSERITVDHIAAALTRERDQQKKVCADHEAFMAKLREATSEKKEPESQYDYVVLEQFPEGLKALCEHRASLPILTKEASVYLLYGERGLGKTTAVKALAERKNAELVQVKIEDIIDPIVGKTQHNLEHFFAELRQREKEGKRSIIFFRGIDRLFPHNAFGAEEPELVSLRTSFLHELETISESTIVLLAIDGKKELIHHELLMAIGSDRCLQFTKPQEVSLRQALIDTLCSHYLKQQNFFGNTFEYARRTAGCTCTDLLMFVRLAARKAALDNASLVNSVHFEQACHELEDGIKARIERSGSRGLYI